MSDKARKKIKRTIHKSYESGASATATLRKVYKIADDDSEWEDEEEYEDEDEEYEEEEDEEECDEEEEEDSVGLFGGLLDLLPDEEE